MAKSNMGFIAIILIILAVDVVGGYIIGKKFLIPMSYEQSGTVSGNAPASEEGAEGATAPGFSRDLDPINMNPANSAGEIFSCQITLEAQTQEVITELEQRDQQIKDIILTYLSKKTIAELSDVSQRDEYRKDIIENINSVLMAGEVTNMYVTQWIIQ